MSDVILDGISDFHLREQHVRQYGFISVSPELANALKSYCCGSIVEVMAGTGHLSAALRAAGVALRSTDDFSWHNARNWATYTEVEKLDAVQAASNVDTVIMVWPYMDSTAYRVAQAMKSGAALLYCGESEGGCTANEEFFELMLTWSGDDQFDRLINAHHHRWAGLHDHWCKWVKP